MVEALNEFERASEVENVLFVKRTDFYSPHLPGDSVPTAFDDRIGTLS